MVVDDVSKRHFKSISEHGTQTIQATKEDLIDLKTRAALSTFAIMKPTWEEWSNADPEDIIEISRED